MFLLRGQCTITYFVTVKCTTSQICVRQYEIYVDSLNFKLKIFELIYLLPNYLKLKILFRIY